MKVLRSAKAVNNSIGAWVERSVNLLAGVINTQAKTLTPVRTGRARRGWTVRDRFKLGRNARVIENLVPYIGILDRRINIIQQASDRAIYITRRRT